MMVSILMMSLTKMVAKSCGRLHLDEVTSQDGDKATFYFLLMVSSAPLYNEHIPPSKHKSLWYPPHIAE